jgi:nitrate/TMAO reductase-like tetraheme cytochrome c subunit
VKLPKFLQSTTGRVITIGVVFVLLLSIFVLSWSHSRFTRANVCLTCHEIFVDYEEYKQTSPLSESIEDFRPDKEIDLGHFNMTVGCAECHAYPYEEYRESAHYDNERGIKAGCLGCHNPHSVREFLVWKFFYINKGTFGESPFHVISSGLRDIPEWEELRPVLAHKVRGQMLEENSAKCKVCHKTESKWFNKIKRHQTTEKTCIQCHYNLVHEEVKWKEPESTAVEKDETLEDGALANEALEDD